MVEFGLVSIMLDYVANIGGWRCMHEYMKNRFLDNDGVITWILK